MTCNIIKSGSTGNALVLNESILVDCGVPFRELEPVKKQLKLVLLTHEHGDHFKTSAVRSLHLERPTLRWGCCEWMVPHLLSAGVDKRFIDVFQFGKKYAYSSFACVSPYKLFHDVPNCGYHIISNGETAFYATDTASLDGIRVKGCDLYLIEANYIQSELEERARNKIKSGEYSYEYRAARNHLSREQAEEWLYSQIGPKSRYIFLHQHKERE